MAIKHGSKVDKSFSASSMTDLMFLLLLFLLIATTLINPNALKLMLPKSSNQLKDKAMTTVSVQDAGHGKYRYYVELQDVGSIGGVERALKARLDGQKDATVSLHCDKTVAFDEVVAGFAVFASHQRHDVARNARLQGRQDGLGGRGMRVGARCGHGCIVPGRPLFRQPETSTPSVDIAFGGYRMRFVFHLNPSPP